MSIDKKILEELTRHNRINKYITEQEALGAELPAEVPAGDELGEPAPTDAAPEMDPSLSGTESPTPEVIDVNQDSEVEKIDDSGQSTEEESSSEELDITDLVNSQKNVENKQSEYFDMLFKQLENLQGKLGEMDNLVGQLNSIEEKLEKYRPKTPEEKLELRSLDSGPFKQKLSDFFQDKQEDMEKTGKNEYVLTSDEATEYIPSEIKKTFDQYGPEPTGSNFKMG
jgi:hypothetical protein